MLSKVTFAQRERERVSLWLLLKDIKFEIRLSSKKKIEEGSTFQRLLANLENNYQIDDTAFEDNQDKTIKITIYDNRVGKEIETVWF